MYLHPHLEVVQAKSSTAIGFNAAHCQCCISQQLAQGAVFWIAGNTNRGAQLRFGGVNPNSVTQDFNYSFGRGCARGFTTLDDECKLTRLNIIAAFSPTLLRESLRHRSN